MGCPIRIPADQRFFAAPRGFSQLSTSFIATVCQGIHRVPLCRFYLHGLHNPQAGRHHKQSLMSSIFFYLDQKLLHAATNLQRHTLSFLFFYYPHYVKEHSRLTAETRKQPGHRNPLRPVSIASYQNRRLPYLLSIAYHLFVATSRGATGIRTPDPLLAKQVL